MYQTRCAIAVLVLSLCAFSSTVDTLQIRSTLLGRSVDYIVVRPQGYTAAVQTNSRYPVLYLLHCAGCDHLSWVSESYCEGLAQLCDSVHLIVVAPYDGTSSSWWLDSPLRADSRMSSFLIEELKPHIDSSYATCPQPDNTGLAGHSMGGFGALHNAMYYPEVFGVAVGIKSGVDLLNPSWPSDFGLAFVLGRKATNRVNWEWATVLGNAGLLSKARPALRIYRGVYDDWFAEENVRLHATLDSLGVEHDYIELDQTHYRVTRDVTRGMLKFCDSAFPCSPGAGSRGNPHSPRQRHGSDDAGESLQWSAMLQHRLASGYIILYTVSGRRVDTAHPTRMRQHIYIAQAVSTEKSVLLPPLLF